MKNLLFITIALLCSVSIYAQSYQPAVESLKYSVNYKWGLINKRAGIVTLTTHDFKDGLFKSTLVGRSATWADKFYTVRDTLMGTMMTRTMEPVFYEKVSHEGGEFRRDIIKYDRTKGDSIIGNCDRWRQRKKDKEVVYSQNLLKATGMTLDMLSSFYYMRQIDYTSMKPGDSVTTNIFSGNQVEILKITYLKNENVEIDNTNYDTYYIKFSFTSKGGQKSSDDMFAWISTDKNRIPVMLLGNLPIGSIRCYYQP